MATLIHKNHLDMLEDTEVLATLCTLFDPMRDGCPKLLDDAATCKKYYDPMLERLEQQCCADDATADEDANLDADTLRREFYGFIRLHLKAARDHCDAALPKLQSDERDRINDHNKTVREHNQKKGNETTQLPEMAMVLPKRVPVVQIIKFALGSDAVGTKLFTSIEFLMFTYLVAVLSQARIEAIFSKLKKFVTRSRIRLSQEHVDMLLYIICNGPDSQFGKAAKYTVEEMLEAACVMYTNIKVRKLVGKPKARENYDLGYKFGEGFCATAEGIGLIEKYKAEAAANANKRTAATASAVADYEVGSNTAPTAEHVWVKCQTDPYDASIHRKRACYVDQGDRTPQIGDEVAITGWGGQVWWEAKIYDMDPPKKGKKARSPAFSVSVFMVGDLGKTEGLKLSSKTYGPAQCKIGDVRLDGKTHPDSFTAGWVFLVPTADAEPEGAAAAAEAEN